ncbi:MAG: glycosyltransferase [Nitrospinota bacterium]
MSPPSELSISVIVPVRNGGRDFLRCLSSICESVHPPSEIIVVVDGDADDSWYLAKEFSPKVLRIPVPGGPARARNLGARSSRGDVLFFVDADVAVYPNATEQIVTAFGRDPDLAALIGSYDDSPAATNFLSQYKNLLHHYVHQKASQDASTFWGACGAVRREVFLALGGFDEGYRQSSIEDIELGYRLKKAGHKIRLCKSLQVTHLKHWGVVSLLKSDFLHRALPWTELILRDRRFIYDLNLRLSSCISVALTWGTLAALAGTWWWLGFLPVAGLLTLSLLALNISLYRFFQRKRGLWFAIRTIPWHWLYYFYSGLAFAIGVARYLSHGGRRPGAHLSIDTQGAPCSRQRPEPRP